MANLSSLDPSGPEKIKIGISTCLLGQKVRYDGNHSHDRYLTQTLGLFVDYVPVCPEVECGMPVPREAVRLMGDPECPGWSPRRPVRIKPG